MKEFSRRDFLKAGSLAAGSAFLASCGVVDSAGDSFSPGPEASTPIPTEVPTPTERPWTIEEQSWHFLGEWQRVETTNQETGETVGFNVRFAVTEGLPFDRIDFATAESVRGILDDVYPLQPSLEEQKRRDLEALLSQNPDGWAESDMALAISLALDGAQSRLANTQPSEREKWREFIELVRERGVVFIFHNDQVLGNTQNIRLGRPSGVNYPPEELLPEETLLGYMEPVGVMFGNAPRITRRWVGLLPDGTPCFYISARKAWREFSLSVLPEVEDFALGAFLTGEILISLNHFNSAFVGDPPEQLVSGTGSDVFTNDIPHQEFLTRFGVGNLAWITGLTVPPGSQDPDINYLP